jgi:hypothetical protein
MEVVVRSVRSMPARLTVALGLAAGAALAAPAGAETSCFTLVTDGPQYCEQQVWFTPAETKAGNLGATGATGFPSWSTEAPKQSVAQGAGGGYGTVGVTRQQQGTSDPSTGALFQGTFTGDLNNLAVTMYLFAPGRQEEAGYPNYYAGIDVVVDGKTVFQTDADGIPLTSGGRAVQKIDFAVDGLQKAIDKAGVATGPDVKHDVELYLTSYSLVTSTALIVYGTTEAPSSMTFNVSDLTGRFVL